LKNNYLQIVLGNHLLISRENEKNEKEIENEKNERKRENVFIVVNLTRELVKLYNYEFLITKRKMGTTQYNGVQCSMAVQNTHHFRSFKVTFADKLKFSLIEELTYEIDVVSRLI
jgi:hypothetical protein